MLRKSRMLLIFSIIVALSAVSASVSIAATKPVHGWHMGTNWQQTSFSAKGVVNAIDAANLTMAVQLDVTSRLLRDYNGTTFDFVLTAKTKVAGMVNGGMGYSNMMVNPSFMMSNSSTGGTGMMNGGMANGGTTASVNVGPMGNNVGGTLTLADVQIKDNIQLLGYQDTTTGNFVVTWILVWLY